MGNYPSQIKVWLEILQFVSILALFRISTNTPILVWSPTSQPFAELKELSGPPPCFGATGLPKARRGVVVQTGHRGTWWRLYPEARLGVSGLSSRKLMKELGLSPFYLNDPIQRQIAS